MTGPLETRAFITSDTKDVLELWSRNKTTLKEEIHSVEEHVNAKFHKYIHEPNRFRLFVVCENSEVVATFGACVWQYAPFFTIIDVSIDRRHSYSFSTQVLDAGFERMLSTLHAEGRYTFLFLTIARAHHKRTFARGRNTEMSSRVPIFARYHFSVEGVIPPNTFPECQLFKELMCNRTHSRELWVRMGTLQQKHRNHYLGFADDFRTN